MTNILITGANEGIGYFLVKQLLEDGSRVAVLDLHTENLELLAHTYGPRLLYFTCDVRDGERLESCVRETLQAFSTIDIAVHNACFCPFSPAAGTQESVCRDVFDVNYFGALRLSLAVLPYMLRQKRGRIIFTSSGVGSMGFASLSPYASSKGAIESLAKCLGLEYRNSGVTFHLFQPPLTRTGSSAPLPVPQAFMADPGKVGSGLAAHIQDRRFLICHSFLQWLQMRLCYLFSVSMGRFLSDKMAGLSG